MGCVTQTLDVGVLTVTVRMCATRSRPKGGDRNCAIDERKKWPLGAALQEEASNRPEAALIKSQGGERTGKSRGLTAAGEEQEDECK